MKNSARFVEKPRRPRLGILLLTLGLWCITGQECRGGDWLAESGWRLNNVAEGDATLAQTTDGLSVNFKSKRKSPIELTCASPIDIPADAKRLTLWVDPASMGNAASWKVLKAAVHGKVRDAKGGTHRFPFLVGSICDRGWGKLTTEDLGYAPYQPAGEKIQGPLQLVGLDICSHGRSIPSFQLHGLSAENDAHTLPCAPWEVVSLPDPAKRETWHSWTGSGVEYDAQSWSNAPYLTLDALINRPGEYTVGIKLRDDWEGPVVAQWQQNIVLPTKNFETEKRQPFSLTPPRPGTYFLEARVWTKDCSLLALKHFLLFAASVKEAPPANAHSATKKAGGFLYLTTDRPQHVFSADETPAFKIHAQLPTKAGKKSLHVLLANYQFEVLKEETLSIPETAGDDWDAKVEFPPETVEACRALIELRVDDKLVDKDSLVLGKQQPPKEARRAVHALSSTSTPLPNGMTSSALLAYLVPPEGLDTVARVGRGMDQAALNGNSVVEIQVPWQDLEPLPGLYQFSQLDKILDLAEQKRLKVMLDPWLLADHLPRWLLPHVASYEDGSTSFIGGSHHAPSGSDPLVQQSFVRLWQAMAKRYCQHPGLGGYLIVGPALDLGSWHNGLLHQTDYSPAAITNYQRYLKEVCHYTLAEVNKRYAQAFTSWSDVVPPAGDWEKELDLRPRWVDFCGYQQWDLYQWMEKIFQAIRTEDSIHDLVQYQFTNYGPQEYYYPLFQKYHVAATTGGTEGTDYPRFVSLYHLWGLRSRGGETIQTVEKWNLYRSLFNMLAYGGEAGYYAVQWHEAFPEPWDTEPNGAQHLQSWSTSTVAGGWLNQVKSLNFAPDFTNASRVLQELGDAKPMPLDAGSLSSYANCLYKGRTLLPYFISGTAITKAWMEKEHRLPLWISESTPLELFRNLKLLTLDADIPAISQSTAEKLIAYVKAGGCLATFVPTGKYTVETAQPDFGFLTRLGFPNRALLPKAKEGLLAHGTGFLSGETLVFNNLYTVPVPATSKTLAALPNGTPCVLQYSLGAGEVILFLGELDWEKSSHVLDALCRHRDVQRWCDATDRRFQVYALQRGEARYVFAYYADPRRDATELPPPASAKVKVQHLTALKYMVSELIGNQVLGSFTSTQLENGMPVTLQPGELKILKYLPVAQ